MLRRALSVYEVDSSIVGTRGIQDSLIREEEKRERNVSEFYFIGAPGANAPAINIEHLTV